MKIARVAAVMTMTTIRIDGRWVAAVAAECIVAEFVDFASTRLISSILKM
jgi:hypothetical protein